VCGIGRYEPCERGHQQHSGEARTEVRHDLGAVANRV
jgi:hypothetical protein